MGSDVKRQLGNCRWISFLSLFDAIYDIPYMKGITSTSIKMEMTELAWANSMRETIHDDDEQKWIDASRSDPNAFDHLYNRYISRVFRYIFHRLNNHEDAEEITSQTFLAALEGMDRYEHRGSFISWLITIARNKLHDHFRRQHPQYELGEEICATGKTDPLGVVIENEQNRHLIDLISALPLEEQELLRLRFVAELTFTEIAALLGKNESAVKKKIYRIILRLQDQVEVNHD